MFIHPEVTPLNVTIYNSNEAVARARLKSKLEGAI